MRHAHARSMRNVPRKVAIAKKGSAHGQDVEKYLLRQQKIYINKIIKEFVQKLRVSPRRRNRILQEIRQQVAEFLSGLASKKFNDFERWKGYVGQQLKPALRKRYAEYLPVRKKVRDEHTQLLNTPKPVDLEVVAARIARNAIMSGLSGCKEGVAYS